MMKADSAKINNFLFRILFFNTQLILFVPIFIWPLFYGYISSKIFYILFFSHLIFFLWILFLANNKAPSLCRNTFNVLLFVFIFVLFLASFFGINLQKSLWENFERGTGWMLIFYLFLFFISTNSFFNKKHWEKFIFTSMLVGLLVSLSTVLAKFGLGPGLDIRHGTWLGNSSFLGTYLVFILFLSAYLLFEDRPSSPKIFLFFKKEIKFLSALAMIFSALALFYSTARAAAISAFLGIIMLYLLYLAFREEDQRIKKIGRVFLAVFIVLLLSLIILFHIPESIGQKALNQHSTRSRTTVWSVSWKLAKERPVLGWGPANFEDAFARHFDARLFLPEYGGETHFDKAHNVVFDTLVNSGFTGLIAYLSIFIYALYFLWRGFLRQKLSFWLAASFTSLLIAYFLQNLTVFDTPVSYFMFFFVLAFLASLEREQKEVKPDGALVVRKKINSPKKIGIALIFAIFTFSFYVFIFRPIATNYYITQMVKDWPIDKKTDFYIKSQNASSFGAIQIREHYAREIRAKFEENLASKKDLAYAAEVLEKTRKEFPYSFYSRLNLAQIYNLLGEKDPDMLIRAEEVLNETLKLSPKNPYSYWYLAQIKILQEKHQEALDLAKKVIDVEPRISSSHFLYLRIAKLMGDKDLIEKKTKEIETLFPNEATSIDLEVKVE